MSATQQSIESAVAQYQAKLTVVSVRAVSISVGTMVGATLGMALLFNLLRPKNKEIYATRIKYSASESKWESEGTFGWVQPWLHTKEPELFEVLGLDAVVFLRFMRMMRWIFTVISVLSCCTLVPINITYTRRNVPSDHRNAMSDLTISNVKGNILFVHIGVSYLINLIVLAFIWHNQTCVTNLRRRWFHSPYYRDHIFSRTLSIVRIPETDHSDRQLASLFNSLKTPYPALSANIGRDVGDLPDLITQHNKLVENLEKTLAKYLKGDKIEKKRPKMRVGGLKFLPVGGKLVDKIQYLTEEIEKLQAEIHTRRESLGTKDACSYGFISTASIPFNHADALNIHQRRKELRSVLRGARLSQAPHPKDIIWENMTLGNHEQDMKDFIGSLILGFVFIWWTLPVLVISFLANLENVASFVSFLKSWQQKSVGTFSAVSGILPPVVAGVFAFLLPIIIRKVIRLQGITTETELEPRMLSRYFDFVFISQLIVFSCISVLFNLCVGAYVQLGEGKTIAQVFHNLGSLPGTVQSTYIIESTYWITWLPARGFAAVFDLVQLVHVLLTRAKRLMGKSSLTPRQIRDLAKPQRFKYEILYANYLFMCAIGLVYAPLAPLVAIVCMAILWIWGAVYRYQLMFAFITEVESGGRQWPIVINRLLISLAFANLLFALTIALARHWVYFVILIPPTMALIVFKWLLSKHFDVAFMYLLPKDQEVESDTTRVHEADARRARLSKRYEHPCLTSDIYVPLVDAKLAHLIPQIYSGPSQFARPISDKDHSGQALDTAVVDGGLQIAAVEESQLEYRADERASEGEDSDSDFEEIVDEVVVEGRKFASKAEARLKRLFQPINIGRSRSGRRQEATRSGSSQLPITSTAQGDVGAGEGDAD